MVCRFTKWRRFLRLLMAFLHWRSYRCVTIGWRHLCTTEAKVGKDIWWAGNYRSFNLRLRQLGLSLVQISKRFVDIAVGFEQRQFMDRANGLHLQHSPFQLLYLSKEGWASLFCRMIDTFSRVVGSLMNEYDIATAGTKWMTLSDRNCDKVQDSWCEWIISEAQNLMLYRFEYSNYHRWM